MTNATLIASGYWLDTDNVLDLLKDYKTEVIRHGFKDRTQDDGDLYIPSMIQVECEMSDAMIAVGQFCKSTYLPEFDEWSPRVEIIWYSEPDGHVWHVENPNHIKNRPIYDKFSIGHPDGLRPKDSVNYGEDSDDMKELVEYLKSKGT
jgi:hypothetical protein